MVILLVITYLKLSSTKYVYYNYYYTCVYNVVWSNWRIFILQTNTYQAVVVTNGTRTIVQFTYLCNGMEWSNSGNKFSVVGLNLYDDRQHFHSENYGGSGSSVINNNVGNCPDSHVRKRNMDMEPTGYSVACEGDSCICLNLIGFDETVFKDATVFENISNTIPSCPTTHSKADDDPRFVQHDTKRMNCFIWVFYERYNRYSFTKECCYSIKSKE